MRVELFGCQSKQMIKNDVFVLLRARNKEKILGPHEESKLRPLDSAL